MNCVKVVSRAASSLLITVIVGVLVGGIVCTAKGSDHHSAPVGKKPANPTSDHDPHHAAPDSHHAPVTGEKPAVKADSHHHSAPVTNVTASDRPPQLLVILIGGMDSDPTARQIAGTAMRKEGNSGLYRLRGDLTDKSVLPEYFNWNGSRAGELSNTGTGDSGIVTRFIEAHLAKHPHDRVAIVGNSWGAHTAWEVLTQLRDRDAHVTISLAVFLDGSSAGRARLERKGLPANVSKALNIHTRNSFVWGRVPAGGRIENIDLGDPAQGFLRHNGPAYDRTLNFRAHVSAEWDEEVHSLIRKRLQAVIPDSATETHGAAVKPAAPSEKADKHSAAPHAEVKSHGGVGHGEKAHGEKAHAEKAPAGH